MRIRTLTLVAALLATVAPASSAAQGQYHADFPKVREQFQRGDARAAAYTLMLAAAHVREEVGRAKEGEVGERLLAAESRLDQLVARLRGGDAGGVTVGTLDAAFAATDRVLAEHHVRLASWGWTNLRLSSGRQIGHALGRATFHFTRAVQAENGTLDPLAKQAVADAERLSSQLATGEAEPPKEAGAVIAALSRAIAPPQTVAEQTRR